MIRYGAAAILVGMAAGGCGSLAPPAPAPLPAVSAGAPAWLPALEMAAKGYPGVAFAVIGPEGKTWTGALGLADTASGAAMTAQTPVSVYSVTKPMTAALAMKLVEQRRLDLDRPIGETASVPPALAGLKARELLTHTAGVRHYRNGEWLSNARRPCASPKEALAAFASDPLGPRGNYLYSSFGYVLLSDVLEQAGARPFAELLAEYVLQPAGLEGASTWVPGLRRPPNGHEKRGARFTPAQAIDNSCKFGAGSLTASAEDLARFGAALVGGRIVNSSSWQAMTAAQNNYGLGLGVAKLADGAAVATHSGSAIGGTSAIAIDIGRGIAVGVVGNAEGDSLAPTARTILELARASPDFS
jgi:CubicO group peptidase (beta-lactamase class C family)